MHVTSALRPGLAFMTMHFPDEVETNRLTIEATDPKSGTAEFKATAIRVEKLNGQGSEVASERVDLHLMTAEATAAERAAVDVVLGPPETSWEGGVRTAVDLRTLAPRRTVGRSCCPYCTASRARSGGSARAA